MTVGRELMAETATIGGELRARFPAEPFLEQATRDGIPTFWVSRDTLPDVLRFLKNEVAQPYPMLWDLTAIDERERRHREGQPPSDFTAVYHLLSFDRNADVRLKVALTGEKPSMPTITGLWPSSELVRARGLGHVRHRVRRPPEPAPDPDAAVVGRPSAAQGASGARDRDGPVHAADREAGARAGDAQASARRTGACSRRRTAKTRSMFLNIGPQHPGTHGVLRIVLQLDGEEIVDLAPDIGYHHRGAEKMGERQTWHTYIPYTDRVDYLGGVMNNLAYLLAVEKLAGIEVPDRVKVIRVMMCRAVPHLQPPGLVRHLRAGRRVSCRRCSTCSPTASSCSTSSRRSAAAACTPTGSASAAWRRTCPPAGTAWCATSSTTCRSACDDYEKMVMSNRIFKARTVGVGAYTREEAIEWGVTGPGLRACGVDWDFRKKRPYSRLQNIRLRRSAGATRATATRARQVRVEEMRQSLRIIQQCVDNMPAGPYKADHPLTTPPPKERTMHDIETLITHFLACQWGPVMPAGEACDHDRGDQGRQRLLPDQRPRHTIPIAPASARPSFPHLQMLPLHQPRLDDRRPARDPRQRSITCWPTSTDERADDDRAPRCSSRERNRRDRGADRRRTPIRARRAIEALKIVQRHRGWVSDEALRDVAALISACRPTSSTASRRSTT